MATRKAKTDDPTKKKSLPFGKIAERDSRGRFLPKSALGEFNERLNVGKETGNFQISDKAAKKADKLSDLTDPLSVTALLNKENYLLGNILTVTEKTEEEQKQISDRNSTNQEIAIEKQNRLIDLNVHEQDILELLNEGILELVPHIKETEKYTQLNSTFLNKILDELKRDQTRKALVPFNSNKALAFSDSADQVRDDKDSGSGGGGSSLIKTALEVLGGAGALTALKGLRGKPAAIPEPKPQVAPEEVIPEEAVPEEIAPEMEMPKGLGLPAEGMAAEEGGLAAGETAGVLRSLVNPLGLALAGGLAAHEADRNDAIGKWIDDHFSWAANLDDLVHTLTHGYIGRPLTPQKQGGIATEHIRPENAPMITQEDVKNLPATPPGSSDSALLGPSTTIPGSGDHQSVFNQDSTNLHGGTFQNWQYRDPKLQALPIPGATVNMAEGGTSSQMQREGPIAPFTPSKTFTEKAPQIIGRLKDDFGLNDVQAAGLVGNLGHESAGFNQLQEGGKAPGTGGYGWAQWTGSRRQQYLQWAKVNGLDPASDEANYGFLKHELSTNYKGTIDALKQTNNLADATASAEKTYEIAGVKAMGSRNKYAGAALEAVQNQKTVPVPVQSVTGQGLETATKQKQEIEEAAKKQDQPSVIVNAPATAVSGNQNQLNAPIASVRNDDPVILSALRQDMMMT